MRAIIVPAHGTVVLREDGSVSITDRNRATYLLHHELINAIRSLLIEEKKDDGEGEDA